jgi:hypothetical protein
MPLAGGMIGDQPNSSGMTSMSDDNVIRVPRVTRTGPCSALSIWPADAAGIVTTVFHSLQPAPMNLDAIRAAVRLAVLCDDLAVACSLVERAAGLGPFLPRQTTEMSDRLAIHWELFYEPADRAESLKHWLAVERMWPTLKIGITKEISQVPG